MNLKKSKILVVITIASALSLAGSCFAEEYIFYPNANPESVSVDGNVGRKVEPAEETWSVIRNSAGTEKSDDQTISNSARLEGGENTNLWQRLQRGIFLFDTSSLPDNCEISSAYFSLYISSKNCTLLSNTPFSLGLVSSNPNSNIGLVAEDYSNLGITRYATDIDYINLIPTQYNNFPLNSNGLSAISKTGITKLGTRFKTDIDNVDPTTAWKKWANANVETQNAEGSNKPKLVVECITPTPTPTLIFPNFGLGSMSDILDPIKNTFSDLWTLIALVIGLPLAFYIVGKVISTARIKTPKK